MSGMNHILVNRNDETPGQAFRRVRKERRDKMVSLSADLNISTSHINYAERDLRRIPKWWLKFLPAEYSAAIVPIWIAELEELLPADMEKPRQGGLAGPLVRSRNTGRISRAQGGASARPKSTSHVSAVWDRQPQPYGSPPMTAKFGESPEERAFRRFPIERKP